METLRKDNLGEFLTDFIGNYLDVFFALVIDNPPMDIGEFYERLFYEVSLDVLLKEEEVKQLHHPLHWTLIGNNGSSLFEYVQPNIIRDFSYIKIKGKINPDDKHKVKQEVLKNYGNILLSKLEILANTFPR